MGPAARSAIRSLYAGALAGLAGFRWQPLGATANSTAHERCAVANLILQLPPPCAALQLGSAAQSLLQSLPSRQCPALRGIPLCSLACPSLTVTPSWQLETIRAIRRAGRAIRRGEADTPHRRK